MKTIALWVIALASLAVGISAHMRMTRMEEATAVRVSTTQVAHQVQLQHHYRFERNGASLWRYDETTGETCQVTSNQIDNWSGGHCPTASQEEIAVFDKIAAQH
jgi:hypothetical protein